MSTLVCLSLHHVCKQIHLEFRQVKPKEAIKDQEILGSYCDSLVL